MNIRITALRVGLDYNSADLPALAAKTLHIAPSDVLKYRLIKQSVDARKKAQVHFTLTLDIEVKGDPAVIVRRAKNNHVSLITPTPTVQSVKLSAPPTPRPVVVGCGPAGLFAARTLALAGAKPLLLERGCDVDTRVKDVENLRQNGILNEHSNIQFGEGGAGTFSDGKLHSGIKDPRCRAVLEALAGAGAPQEILWQAKPHIGTDKLRNTVKRLRREIENFGGEVRFCHTVTDITVKNSVLYALTVNTPQGEIEIPCTHAIFALGHSAEDTFRMLYTRAVPMVQKPFAMGVRIEHPRRMIDMSQYGTFAGHPALGAAEYKLSVTPENARGVYTFCMCPGGEVVAAASADGALVVNGMSAYDRAAQNSNSALLVGVGPDDFEDDHPLAGFAYQQKYERLAFALGGGNYRAPAQLVGDFLAGHASTALGDVVPSYRPDVTLCDLSTCLPAPVYASLRAALPLLGKKLQGFDRADAVLTGIESRSSSPVRLARDETGQSAVRGIYPCGEGAGYAGGIMSAAVDGIKCAEWVLNNI